MKPFTALAVILLLAIAIGHLLRVMYSWHVTLAGRLVPMWVSVVAIVVATTLAGLVWREQHRP